MPRLLLPLLFVVLCTITPRASGDLVVDSWELGTAILPSTPPNNGSVFRTVQNPFQDSHSGVLGNSFASATYDFAWSGNEAHFDVFITHHLEQLQGETISSGRIVLRPMVDSFVTFSGTWEYAWPSSVEGTTLLSMSVADIDADMLVDSDVAHGSNLLAPPFGTLNVSGGGLMLAGQTHLLHYNLNIRNFDPTPSGTFGTGAGQLNFTITPVPEPAALAMLVLPMLLLRRAKRSRA